jgi:hypothetical protein
MAADSYGASVSDLVVAGPIRQEAGPAGKEDPDA